MISSTSSQEYLLHVWISMNDSVALMFQISIQFFKQESVLNRYSRCEQDLLLIPHYRASQGCK